MITIEVPLTDRESQVLKELSNRMDLAQTKIMIMGLRLYQLFVEGKVKVIQDTILASDPHQIDIISSPIQ